MANKLVDEVGLKAVLTKLKAKLSKVALSGKYDDLDGKPALAEVATTGSYEDLLNKPDLDAKANKADLAKVATTGSYNDLKDVPNILEVVDGMICVVYDDGKDQ